MKNKKLFKYLFSLLGVFLFLYIIIYIVDLDKLLKNIANIKIIYFVPIFGLSFILVGLKAYRWQLIMRKIDITYSLYSSFSMYAVGAFLSLVTPGKIGELAKIFYLNKDQHSIKKSLVTIIVDRMADLVFLILLVILGFAIFFEYFAQPFYYLIFILLLTVVGLYITFKYKLYLILIKIISPKKYKQVIFENTNEFFALFKTYSLRDYITALIITSFSWITYIIQIYLLTLALNININFLYLIPMIAVANAADMLPISISGIGTRELIFIFFFSLIGLSAEKATALGILQLSIVVFTALIGLAYCLKYPLSLKQNNE
ncbi:flippase-like domain-containing protein [Patescibacteria group bacterium]|nr:flippase-like domain-containing protein [Patescibacteria group bacterium]